MFFADKCFKIKLLMDMCNVFCRIKKMHRFAFSIADINTGHCVEFTFLEGKLGWFLTHVKSFLIRSFLKLLHFESESESRFNSAYIYQ